MNIKNCRDVLAIHKRVIKDIKALRSELAWENHLLPNEINYKLQEKLQEALDEISLLVDTELEEIS
jgi:hypothetical protein